MKDKILKSLKDISFTLLGLSIWIIILLVLFVLISNNKIHWAGVVVSIFIVWLSNGNDKDMIIFFLCIISFLVAVLSDV
jgi:hypothetical protein